MRPPLPPARENSARQMGCRLDQVLRAALSSKAAKMPGPRSNSSGTSNTGGFPCGECGRLFSTKGNMMRHVQATHRGEGVKMFPCETCGKSFKRKEDLVMHIRVHTGASIIGV